MQSSECVHIVFTSLQDSNLNAITFPPDHQPRHNRKHQKQQDLAFQSEKFNQQDFPKTGRNTS